MGWTSCHRNKLVASQRTGANDGVLTLWLDRTQVGTVTTMDTGTRGTEYFDAFISQCSSYIGLVAPSGVEMVKNDLPEPTRDSDILPVVYQPSWLFKPLDVSQMTGLADAPRTITYTYDPLGRLTSANYGDGNYFVYTYDAVGNRLTETTQFGTTTYTYDDANRLATVNAVSYTWDDNGNLLSDGVSTYTYDHANRLRSVTTGGTTYTYAYNGLGDRVSQTVGEVTTTYTLDLNARLTQVLADGTNTYLYGYERIAQFSATETGYYLGDALGSVRQMADEDGVVTLTKQYKPFGELLSSTGSGELMYGFAGEQTDATGLQYLRARYYSGLGRFVSRDSQNGDPKSPLSYNLWIFGYSNPETYTDPSGKSACDLLPYDWQECQQKYHKEQGDDLKRYVNNYDEKVKPPYINFIGKDISPMKIYTYVNGYREDHSTVDGAQVIYLQGGGVANGLCGQFALAAILGLDSDSIMAYFNMALPGRVSNPNDTNLDELVKVIEMYIFSKDYLKKLNLRYESDQGHSVIDYGVDGNHLATTIDYFKFGKKATEYLRNGYSIICGMTIDADSGRLMNISVGNRFSQGGRRFTGHWIDITGISSDWGDQYEFIGDYQGRDAVSPWKWLRIYNPYDNETEYYWWGDLVQKTYTTTGRAIGNYWLPIKTD